VYAAGKVALLTVEGHLEALHQGLSAALAAPSYVLGLVEEGVEVQLLANILPGLPD
jgi:hypothetical protein